MKLFEEKLVDLINEYGPNSYCKICDVLAFKRGLLINRFIDPLHQMSEVDDGWIFEELTKKKLNILKGKNE